MIYRGPWWGFRRWLAVVLLVSLAAGGVFAALAPRPLGSRAWGVCPEWKVGNAAVRAGERAVFIYVNGVDTPPLDELDALCNVERAVASLGLEHGMAGDPRVLVRTLKKATPSQRARLMRCTGVVGLAPPVSVPFRGDVVSARLWVRGDIIYSPAARRWTHVRPPQDEIVATAHSPAPGDEFDDVGRSVALHGINGSYLGQPQSRRRVVAALDSVYRALEGRDCPPVPRAGIAGAWSGRVATVGRGTLRLSTSAREVRGTWTPDAGGAPRPVPVRLLSRRRMEVRFPAPDTTVGLYLVNDGASGFRIKVLDPTDEVQGGRQFLDRAGRG